MGKRTIRPRAASQQHPSAADIMGETVSIGSEDKLDVAEQKIRLEWERMVSHQEGEEVRKNAWPLKNFPMPSDLCTNRLILKYQNWKNDSGTTYKSTKLSSVKQGTPSGGKHLA